MRKPLVMRQHTLQFKQYQEEELLEYLERTDNCTIKQLISSPRDIALGSDGKLTSNGYMLTPLAFKQLCQHTANGLYGLVADIGEVRNNARSLDRYTSPALAAEIINKVVNLRFGVPDGISTKAMIMNSESKTVDGIVGARYRYVPHHQLFRSLKEHLESSCEVQFARAIVNSRRLSVTFIDTGSVWSMGQRGMLYPLMYMTNSEAGEAGIHAGAGIYLTPGNYFMLGPLRHVAHNNADFDARLTRLVSYIEQQSFAIRANLSIYADRLTQSLHIVRENKIWDARRKLIEEHVARFVDKALAVEVVRKAIFQGEEGTKIPARVNADTLNTRTIRDLVATLCREGGDKYHTIREQLERAAFSFTVNSTT